MDPKGRTIQQTSRVEGKRIFSTTGLRLPGDSEAVVRAVLERPWSWWRHGRVKRWRRRDDGGTRFVLRPAWPLLPSKVGVDLDPPETAEEDFEGGVRRKTVLLCRFFAGFDGPGRYEILDLESDSFFRAVWDGVEPRSIAAWVPIGFTCQLHLRSEHGNLWFPFPKGTGYLGLSEYLSGRS